MVVSGEEQKYIGYVQSAGTLSGGCKMLKDNLWAVDSQHTLGSRAKKKHLQSKLRRQSGPNGIPVHRIEI